MSGCAQPGNKRRLFKDAGRACPIDYRISEKAFAGQPEMECDVLYVIGGLYGNPFALDAIDDMVTNENNGANVKVVLNGDMHWFDKTAANFANVENRTKRYIPLVGNVEAELRRQTDVGVGCGCAYPDCTADDAVARSNRIHRMLSVAIEENPCLKEMLQGRPATLCIKVCGKKIAISHGDEKLIGGWDCSLESMRDVMRQDELDSFMEINDIDVFTTTHTCTPVACTLARGVFINNGSAGLPNFKGQHFGLCVRIANVPAKDSLFGCKLDGLYIQAVPVRYDHDAYLNWFDALWDDLSPAAISYRDRIVHGADNTLEKCLLGGFKPENASLDEAEDEKFHSNTTVHKAEKHDLDIALARLLYFEDMVENDACLHTVDVPNTMQLNITAKCNLTCEHCHVNASPHRIEAMSHDTLQAALDVCSAHNFDTIDITGGAPEMHPDIEWLLREAVKRVPRVLVRTNLVILEFAKYSHIANLYEELMVEIVASLPNVFKAQSDSQRGFHVYDSSINVLKHLNELGYGTDGKHILNLVFNPQQPVLPPAQSELEKMYKRRLETLGIHFDSLFAVANNPIGRYGLHLMDTDEFEPYMEMLMDNFNPDACQNMMCRTQLNVGWDGSVYDCDFNQAIGLHAQGSPNIFDYANDKNKSLKRDIAFGNHCYACTAGFGSSCSGTLVQGV